MCVSLCVQCQSGSPRPSDLQRQGGREADSAHSEAEDELSPRGSELRAALELCRVSVGLGSVEATPGLDYKVSHIHIHILKYLIFYLNYNIT